MELTVEFIRESFHKYNKKYFKGELIEPIYRGQTQWEISILKKRFLKQ